VFVFFRKNKNNEKMPIPQIKRPPSMDHLEILHAEIPMELTIELREKYWVVYERLKKSWGTMDFYSYSKSLIINEDEKIRKGFSVDAMLELYRLIDDHDATFPKLHMKLCNREHNYGA
jgi:hypothetical protein